MLGVIITGGISMQFKKTFISLLSLFLLISGLLLFYTSNINKTLFVDISAASPFTINAENQEKGVVVNKTSENNYTVLLSSNFFYQTKSIHLTNIKNEDFTFKFYSEQKKEGNKEIKFSINIKNIKINGQDYHKKKETVWYERPFIDTVSVNKDEVSFSLKYKTKLMLRNTFIPQSIVSIVFIFFSFLLSFLLLYKCFLGRQIKKIIQYAIFSLEKYGEWDLFFIQRYRALDVVYKKTFWTVFIILNIVFLYYNIHFIWGNHDWWFAKDGYWGLIFPEVTRVNGRFSAYWLNQVIGGRFIPVVTVSFILFGLSFTGVLLAYYWKLQKTFFNYLVLSLIVVLNPLVIYWLYFVCNVVSHLWCLPIVIGALIVSEKKSLYYFFIAYLLFFFCLGVYPYIVNTIAVVFFAKILLTFCFEEHSISFLYQKFKRTLCCIVISLISYKVMIDVFIWTGIIEKVARTSANLFGGSLDKFIIIVKDSFKILFYTCPFYDTSIIQLISCISIVSLITLFLFLKKYNIKISQLCFIIAGICLLPIVSNATSFIFGSTIVMARAFFYGEVFLFAFFVLIILKAKLVWAKNILIVCLIFLLPMNVYRLVDAQKLWKLEFDYENSLLERVLEEVELSPDYKLNENYTIIICGERPFYAVSFYTEPVDSLDVSFLTRTSFHTQVFGAMMRFYRPQFNANSVIKIMRYDDYRYLPDIVPDFEFINKLLPYHDVLKNKLQQWPSKNFVLVQDNYIFIDFDNELLQTVITAMEEENPAEALETALKSMAPKYLGNKCSFS